MEVNATRPRTPQPNSWSAFSAGVMRHLLALHGMNYIQSITDM